jgi:hypothetical protein
MDPTTTFDSQNPGTIALNNAVPVANTYMPAIGFHFIQALEK